MADEEEEDNQPALYDEDEAEGGVFRWMSALVVLLAVAGFFGLAWYAYRNGGDTVDDKDVELIKADKTPVKEAPANPGGMQIPNQDKTVYGLISGKNEKPVVERILPAPEEPLARGRDTETWMSDSLKNKTGNQVEAVKMTPSASATVADSDASAPKEQFDPAKQRTMQSATAAPVAPVSTAPITTAAKPEGPATPAPVASATLPATPAPVVTVAPAPVKSTSAPSDKSADNADDSDDDQETKTEAKPAVVSSASAPGIHVQLGAYKSQGEAESNWKKISRDFSDDVKSKKHYVARADLGGKGVYYRLQVAPFSSSRDAEAFCLDFVSAGRGCFLAKGK